MVETIPIAEQTVRQTDTARKGPTAHWHAHAHVRLVRGADGRSARRPELRRGLGDMPHGSRCSLHGHIRSRAPSRCPGPEDLGVGLCVPGVGSAALQLRLASLELLAEPVRDLLVGDGLCPNEVRPQLLGQEVGPPEL